MNHIEVYAQLIKLKIHNKPVTPQVFYDLTSLVITEQQLEVILHEDYKPQQNQLVQALLNLGVKSRTMAKTWNVSPATISYHKSNLIKSTYINPMMEDIVYGYIPSCTQTDTERRKPQIGLKRRKRRTKLEMQQARDQKDYIYYQKQDALSKQVLNNMFTS